MNSQRIPWRSHYALALLTLIYSFQFIDRQIMAVLLEPIRTEFRASDTAMGLVSGFAFAVFYATVGVPLARLADRMARTTLLAACCATWSGFTALCGTAKSLAELMAARVGVAAGEAGCTPLAISLIADLYPRARRSFAMSVYGLGPNLGLIAGLSAGGWIAQHHGWRTAFVSLGLPGLALALLMWLMKEPPRGAWDGGSDAGTARARPGGGAEAAVRGDAVSALAVLSRLLRRPVIVLLLAGASGAGFVGYGFGAWNVSFLVRCHGLTLQQAGLLAGLVSGVGALIGTPVSGALCDRFARRDEAWQMWLPALGLAASMLGGLLYCLWPGGTAFMIGTTPVPTALLFSIPFGFFAPWWIAPVYAGIANLTEPGERTLASALLVLTIVLLGGGAGPLFTGLASDALASIGSAEALRRALVLTLLMTVVPVAAFLAAGRRYRAALAPQPVAVLSDASAGP